MDNFLILKMINIENEICPRCKAKNSIIVDETTGEKVCCNCGLVIEEQIFVDEYERRAFINDEENNQIHYFGPLIYPVYSESSIIQNLLSLFNIPQNMIEETKRLYDKFAKDKNMQGKDINTIIIAIYYYVCRKEKCAKTIKEIVSMFKDIFPDLTERIVKKTFNSIKADIIEPEINFDEINDLDIVDEEDLNNYFAQINLESK